SRAGARPDLRPGARSLRRRGAAGARVAIEDPSDRPARALTTGGGRRKAASAEPPGPQRSHPMIRAFDAVGGEAASLRPIVRALGGDLYAGGRRANVPAPGHSPHDRSVSLLLQGGRVVVHTFNGTDWRAVLADLRARGLVDAGGAPAGGGGPGGHACDDPCRPARLAAARRLWSEARPIDGTLSARHARLRGIARALPEALRPHPAAPLAVYTPYRHVRPALVAAFVGPDGELQAVELTYLA